MKEFEKNELVKEKIGKDTVLVSPAGCRSEMMMNLRLWMVALFLLAAVGLLGGCAQSSGDADPDPDDGTTTEDGMVDERGPYQVAVEESNKAKSAKMMANDAMKEAMELSGKLKAFVVEGDSGTAMDNAQKVLDAKTTIEGALTAAKEALAALEAARDEADEAAKAELDDVIAEVEMDIEDIEDILDVKGPISLKAYIEKVTGTDEDDLQTAADIGLEVAKAIDGAETPDDAPDVAAINIGQDDSTHEGRDTHEGVTFSEIVGSSIVDQRIAGTATRTTLAVKAVSVAEMAAPGTIEDTVTGTNADVTYPDGYQNEALTPWSGDVMGTYFCVGECTVVSSVFKGDWYFTPADSNKFYEANDSDPVTYSAETDYAEYGYWLTENGTVMIHTYARVATEEESPIGNLRNLDVTTNDANDPADDSATYEGGAIGMSVHGTGDDRQSGEFEADVSLTVKFKAVPNISGTISNFRGNAVGDWTVTLKDSDLNATLENVVLVNGVAVSTGSDGEWTAQGYGPVQTQDAGDDVNHRPTGFFGTFDANFSDGEAVGAYATRKK